MDPSWDAPGIRSAGIRKNLIEDKMKIIIDKEFEQLIPPLSDEEFAGLEKDILENGLRVPLMVWPQPKDKGILVDGHNRYRICKKHKIPYETQAVELASREEALRLILSLQLNRRNLTAYTRAELVLKYEPILRAEAKKRQGTRTDINNFVEKSPQSVESGKTRDQLGKMAGLSGKTIDEVKKISNTVSESVKEKLRAGEVSIHQASQLARLDEQERKLAEKQILTGRDVKNVIDGIKKRPTFVTINSGKAEWYTPAYIIEAARKTMGSIDLDPASCREANKVVKATTFYSVKKDGLKQEWKGNTWLNPPYSNPETQNFINKLLESHVKQACLLVNTATETAWFQKLLKSCDAVCFVDHRIAFWNPGSKEEGTKGLQGQAVFYIGKRVSKFKKAFSEHGVVIDLKEGR